MKINISSVLKNDGSSMQIDFCKELSGFETVTVDVLPDGPVKFEGTIENNKGLLVLKGTVSTRFRALCGRCLSEVKDLISLNVYEELQNIESDTDEYTYTYSGDELDLGAILFDYISLNMPMKVLCSQECRGICPSCGVNLNEEICRCDNEDDINPELSKLKGFFLRNE